MKKSEIVSNYLSLSKHMDNMLDELRVNFKRETKRINGITLNLIDRLDLEYHKEKSEISLVLNIDEKFIQDAIKQTMNIEDSEAEVKVLLATIQLNIGIAKVSDEKNYISFIDAIYKEIENEINRINKINNEIKEKSKSFWYRLFHLTAARDLEINKYALTEADKIKKIIIVEKNFINSDLVHLIVNCFKEESIAVYGISDLKTQIITESEMEGDK